MDRKAFIKSCRRNGYKYVEIARILGLSRQRIDQILKPLKHKAREAVYRAGLKSKMCQYPECWETKTEAHHFDYNKPLEVTWLCVKHHKEFHSKNEVKKIKKVKLCGCGKEAKKWSIRCKDCAKKNHLIKARLRYKNNPEYRRKHKILIMNWRKNNPEKWKAILIKAARKYYETHPQYKYNKDYYIKNRENIRLKQKKYYERNKEKISLREKERYKRKKAVDLST